MDPTTRGLIIEYSTRIEDLLRDNFGAEGDGINEMLDSLGDKIPYDLQQSLRYIASVRNKAAHRYVLEVVDTDGFLNRCKSSISSLEVLSTHEFTPFSSPSREFAPYQQDFQTPSPQRATSTDTSHQNVTSIGVFLFLISIGFAIFLSIGGVQYTQQVFTDLIHAISTAPTPKHTARFCNQKIDEYLQHFKHFNMQLEPQVRESRWNQEVATAQTVVDMQNKCKADIPDWKVPYYIWWDNSYYIVHFVPKEWMATPRGSTASAPSPAGTQTLARKVMATLTGAAESPGPGDTKGNGTSQIMLNHTKTEVCFDVTVRGIQTPTAAHIHQGVAGRAGPVSVPLDAPKTGAANGCKIADAAVVQDMMQNPANYYVNVHNAEFPNGAVRGQLAVQP